MEKQFYDKYGKEFHCATCHELTTCVNRPEPLFPNCCEQYLRDRIAELEEQLKKFESIEKEIGCDIEVFWKVYRKISGHGNIDDLSLYTITDENEIIKIMPTEIISGTYSNYPQDCSFKYWIWDNVKGCYKHTYTYFHFHDYKRYWFLTKEEALTKLEELQGERNGNK